MSRAKVKRKKRPTIQRDQAPEISSRPLLTPARLTTVLILLFLVGVVLRLQHLEDVTFRTADEHVYTRNAKRILEKGFSEFPVMVQEYNRDPELPKYPSPVRSGL